MEKAWKHTTVMESMMQQYTCKAYCDAGEEKIGELFTEVYGREFHIDDWVWRFENNPCRRLCMTTLWDGDKLIAHNALTPCFAYHGGERIISANSGTTMARPEYMGVSLQLFTSCADMYSNFDLIYGFPNKNSYRITTKYLHHRVIGEMCFWTKNVEPDANTYDDVLSINEFTEHHGMLYKRYQNEAEYIVEKSKEYLNWRFIDKPGSGYCCYELREQSEVAGYIVLNQYIENGEAQGQIIDIMAKENYQYLRLMDFANCYFTQKGCKIIKAWASYYALDQLFAKKGYVNGSHPFPMTIWSGNLDLDRCYITMADSDVF